MPTIPVETIAVLNGLLALEEARCPDWCAVRAMALKELDRINRDNLHEIIEDIVYNFLDDVDIREKDSGYAKWQRGKLKTYLSDNE